MAAGVAHDKRLGKVQAELVGVWIGRWLRTQSLAAVILAVALVPAGAVAVYSAVFGSLAAFLPAVFFAVFAGRKIGAESGEFLRVAVVGEGLKLLLSALLCAAVFVWVEPLSAGWFFGGLIAVILAGWVGLAWGLNSGTQDLIPRKGHEA